VIERDGGPVVLATTYDNLVEVVRLRPGAVVVSSTTGAVLETYELLAEALREPGSL
jgi:methylmalonyl-CoA mutase cobalamin-binding subunit